MTTMRDTVASLCSVPLGRAVSSESLARLLAAHLPADEGAPLLVAANRFRAAQQAAYAVRDAAYAVNPVYGPDRRAIPGGYQQHYREGYAAYQRVWAGEVNPALDALWAAIEAVAAGHALALDGGHYCDTGWTVVSLDDREIGEV
jgi:hypothetical protein